MKKKTIIYLSAAAAVILIIIIIGASRSSKSVDQKVKVKKGDFEIVVSVSGELVAPNSVNITGPTELQSRNMRGVNDIKIQDLVPEGTMVDSGDYVATLDPSSVQTRLKDLTNDVDKYKSALDRAVLDTSLNLRTIRNNIKNLEFDVEEKQIVVDQSIYEPPATQRQAKNNLDKSLRDLDQERRNYKLKVDQAIAQVSDANNEYQRSQREYDEMMDVLKRFTVRAPKSGMVIYYKSFGGDKRKAGSSISAWDLIVATLPDFSTMDSRTYVNEIDISKVKSGQKVRLGIDAFPDKKYTGEVISVANVGEQLKNADAKVFEVVVRLNGSDPILRPAMTTSNQIVTASFSDVLYIPIESLFGNDTVTYVYKTNGVKQIVVAGEMNENYRIIEQGLQEGDELYLSQPEHPEKFKQQGEELIPIIKERNEAKKKAEEERLENARKAEEARRKARQQMMGRGGFGGARPGANGGMQIMTVSPSGGGATGAPTQGGAAQFGAGQNRQGGQREIPAEVKQMMEKGDTAGLRKYREERMKQRGQQGQQPQQQPQQKSE